MREKEYKTKEFYWGLAPHSLLVKFLPIVQRGKALDIGAGEGRNSIFLAKNGFEVEAIDINKEGLEKCKQIAKKYNLPITTKVIDIKSFSFEPRKYSLILSIATMDFLKKSEIEIIIKKIKKSLIEKGYVLLLVISNKDPLYQKIKELKLKEVEENTFYLPKYKTFRHFFTQKELKELFKDFKIIYLKQQKIKDIGHGEPHFHNVIGLLAQKIKATD